MKRFFLSCIFLIVNVSLLSEVAVPELVSRVTDQTGTLTSSETTELENILESFEKTKGSQIAILVVPTTEPESIEQYSIRVVEKWKLGRKKVDDGVLLLVAKNDRKLRIEVGYGLEGALTDAISKRIIEEIIKPEFKKGNFYEGMHQGIGQIIKVINGESLPPPPAWSDSKDSSDIGDRGSIIFGIFLLIFFTIRGFFGIFKSSLLIAILAFAIIYIGGWSFGFLINLGIAGLVFILSLIFYAIMNVLPSGGSGYSSGSGWSGRSSGGSSFGGGGGSFGGGGSSGSW